MKMEILFCFVALLFTIIILKTSQEKPKTTESIWFSHILGHLYLYFLKTPIHRTLHSLSNKYGPILFLQFGSRPVLVVSSTTAVEQCFTQNDVTFANRPKFLAAKVLGYNYSTVGFSPYGDRWRYLRRATSMHIFSNAQVQSYSTIRNEETRFLIRRLYRISDGSTGKVNLNSEFTKLHKALIQESNQIESGEFQLKSSISQHPSSKKEEKKLFNKKTSGSKRPLPLVSGRDSKRLASPENGNLMKMCAQVLSKLMKHKRAYIFNSPVDVVALGLHDYNQIIKRPMDLRIVKSNLGKNLYETPFDFASDVRLTFKNTMLYNPKGHEVHELADQLLARFEDSFRPLHNKLEADRLEQQHKQRGIVVDDLQERRER